MYAAKTRRSRKWLTHIFVFVLAWVVLLPGIASADPAEEGEWFETNPPTEIIDVPDEDVYQGVDPWEFQEQDSLTGYLPLSTLTGLASDLSKLVPLGALLDGDLTSLLPDTKIVDDTLRGLLSSIPDLTGSLDGIRDYVASLELPKTAVNIGTVTAPIVDFLTVLTQINQAASLPTTYELRLTRPRTSMPRRPAATTAPTRRDTQTRREKSTSTAGMSTREAPRSINSTPTRPSIRTATARPTHRRRSGPTTRRW